MQQRAERLTHRLRALLLAALLFIPVVASAHHHALDEATPGSCAVCVVAHHAPASAAPAPTAFTLALEYATVLAPAVVAPIQRVHSPITGRAPPLSASTFSLS